MKKISFFLFSLFFCLAIYSQDNNSSDKKNIEKKEASNITEVTEKDNAENDAAVKTSDELAKDKLDEKTQTLKFSNFGFYFGPEIIFSKTENYTNPSLGISTNLGLEYEFMPVKYLSLLPSLDVSIFHYAFLFTDSADLTKGRAYICELENRTAMTMSFLLDIPIMARFDIYSWVLSFGAGVAFFIRGAFLEPGVKADSPNYYDIPAKKELNLINSYFWKNGRFFYPSLGLKTEYIFKSGWKVGLKFKSFIPIFNAWDKPKKNFADSLIIQMSIILHPAKI